MAGTGRKSRMNDNDIMARLILGNVGDETALRNICEAHNQCIDELAQEEKDHMYATNNFYYNAKEFSTIHSEKTDELFHELLEAGTLVATKDGFVWVNCV